MKHSFQSLNGPESPKTSREAVTIATNYRQGENVRRGTSDNTRYEHLNWMDSAELGCRIILIPAQTGLRIGTYGFIGRSKARSPMTTKYYHSAVKAQVLGLEEALSRNLIHAIVDSALFVRLFKRVTLSRWGLPLFVSGSIFPLRPLSQDQYVVVDLSSPVSWSSKSIGICDKASPTCVCVR
ncbi:MAG: hypothetical protein J3Q66DRAFT_44311 [Benniella sp.]|nr:MAG: hypothetical protein J3Q66DRAFT_44311 [Benniella sp.]